VHPGFEHPTNARVAFLPATCLKSFLFPPSFAPIVARQAEGKAPTATREGKEKKNCKKLPLGQRFK